MNDLVLKQAALINIGDNPLIQLLLLVIIVGIAVYIAIFLLNFATFIEGKFKQAAVFLIYAIGIIIVLDKALEVIFGINMFGGV